MSPCVGILQSSPTAMPAPFHKGAYWSSTSAPLVKGWTPPKAEGGFRSPVLSVSCADSSPTGGAKLGLSGPHRPLPPPLGEVPPQGAERVSPAKKKSPGGGLGIDFFPYHVILKIKRGAAGRREPLGLLKEVTVLLGQLGGYFFLLFKNRFMIPTTKMPI